MKRRNHGLLLSLTALGACLGVLVAAAPPNNSSDAKRNPAAETATNQAGQHTSWRNNDHLLASCVALENQEEVALAEWAKDKVKDKDVREFAQMLAKDHRDFLEKLRNFAPEAAADGYLDRQFSNAARRRAASPDGVPQAGKSGLSELQPDSNRQRTNAVQQQAAKPPLTNSSEAPLDVYALHREIVQQCLADTKQMLSDKVSERFDECFIGLQIAKHAAMKTKLSVIERHASGELKELLSSGEKTASEHLDRAEELMKQVAKDSAATASK